MPPRDIHIKGRMLAIPLLKPLTNYALSVHPQRTSGEDNEANLEVYRFQTMADSKFHLFIIN